MKIDRNDLLQKIELASIGVDKITSIEGTNTLVFTNNSVSSYNDSITITIPFESELSGCVIAQDFIKVLKKLKSKEIDIVITEDHWFLKSGKTEVKFFLQKDFISQYIKNIEELEKDSFKELPTDFFDAFSLANITGNESQYKGICIHNDMMLSTDRVRMNYYTMQSAMETYWLDDNSINALVKVNQNHKITEYTASSAWVHFKDDNGLMYSCKRNNEELYPVDKLLPYKEQFEKKDDDVCGELPKDFISVIDRVGTLYDDVNGYQAITIKMQADKLSFNSKSTAGTITESIDWKIDLQDSIQFMADFNFLKEASKKCPQFFLRKNGDDITLVFYNEKYMQVVGTIKE